MRRTSLFLDESLLKKLKRVAAQEGVSLAALVRESVERYLSEHTRKAAVPSVAGRFSSGMSDTGDRVDDLLWSDPHG